MIGSLWTGITGLTSQQAALDNESNNIANVNTVAFKSARVSFADHMYQDGLGKGSFVQDTEKLYSQGGFQSTSNSYDIAINGNGFFSVIDPNDPFGEEYFTRSGNLRMAEDGTLQNSGYYQVQGWAMGAIDPATDIDSTVSSVTSFTTDYTKLAANQIIVTDTDTIETITAKLTDYSKTALTDDKETMSGYGYKSAATKISDIELLMSEYQSALKDFASNPSIASSAPSTQQSTLSFPASATSQISSANDKIYIYLDSVKIEQQFVSTTADVDYDNSGTIDADDDLIASKVATYKALADQISNKSGYEAYLSDSSGNKLTSLDYASFANNPNIQINGLVPGESFSVGDIGEYISSTMSNVDGSTSVVSAVSGTGEANIQALKDALIKAAAGFDKQVWGDYELSSGSEYVTELQYDITLDDGTALSATTLGMTSSSMDETIDNLVTQINTGTMAPYVVASNQNGHLVIESLDTTLDLDGTLTAVSTSLGAAATITGTVNNDSTKSINSGGDAEFLQLKTSVSNGVTDTRSELQLNLETLGISANSAGEFSVDEQGIVTMEQDGATFAVGQLSLSTFINERGLSPQGDNLYSTTLDSGTASLSKNNLDGGKMMSGYLELSTSDLSESLVNLMLYQRAFEANSKSITTSDALLNTIIQLKK